MPDQDKLKPEFESKARPPSLTLYQICILNAIGHSELKNVKLREILDNQGFKQKVAGFGDTMRRLEKKGLVTSRFSQSVVNGHTIKEKHFKISGKGMVSLFKAKNFFDTIEWPEFDK